MSHLAGAWPALMTPRLANGQPNSRALRALIRYLLPKGIGGFYVNGSTGEGIYMSVEEREQTLEVALDEVAGAVPVVAHVGAVAAPDAFRLARHAQAAGAAGTASIVPPLYQNLESMTAYYRRLAACTPDLPFFMYLFGASVPALELARQALDIPNLMGGKYTGPDMFQFARVRAVGQGRSDWYLSSGMDEMCLAAVMAGACGNIGSTLNFMPGPYVRIRSLAGQGRHAEAQELQNAANQVTAVLSDHGFAGSLYAVMQTLDIDSGSPRLPHAALPADQVASLQAALQETRFADLVDM